MRRGGRVAEGARLESVYAGNRIEGSNPSPSAINQGPRERGLVYGRTPIVIIYSNSKRLSLSLFITYTPGARIGCIGLCSLHSDRDLQHKRAGRTGNERKQALASSREESGSS